MKPFSKVKTKAEDHAVQAEIGVTAAGVGFVCAFIGLAISMNFFEPGNLGAAALLIILTFFVPAGITWLVNKAILDWYFSN